MQIEKDHFIKKDGKRVRRKKEKPTPSCLVRSRFTERISGEMAAIAHRRAGIAQRQKRMKTPEGLEEVVRVYLESDAEFVDTSSYYLPFNRMSEKKPEQRALEAHRNEALNAALAIYRKHPGIPEPPNETDNPRADIRAVATWAVNVAPLCKPPIAAAIEGDGTVNGKTGKTTEAKDELQVEADAPKDLISLLVAVKKFDVSRGTLKRLIKSDLINSYRPKNAAKNSPHLVSEAAVASRYNRRR